MGALVVGVGNADCGDDAAGVLVVERLARGAPPGVPCVTAPRDLLKLIDMWATAKRVVLVDASCAGEPPGTLRRFDARAAPLPAGLRPFSTHGFGVVEVIELARALGRLPDRLDVIGIEGASFEPGAPVSEPVLLAVDAVARLLRAEFAPLAQRALSASR